MLFLPQNLLFLRSLIDASKSDLEQALQLSRGQYSNYEKGTTEPRLQLLNNILQYYQKYYPALSLDLLVSHDLEEFQWKLKNETSAVSEKQLLIELKEEKAFKERKRQLLWEEKLRRLEKPKVFAELTDEELENEINSL